MSSKTILSGVGLPPSLKPIATYLQRAKEIAPRDPAVAYYTQLYAVQLALELRPKMAKSEMPVLLSLMDAMEEQKAGIDLSAVEVPSAHVENFAQDLFHRADEADRAGVADMRVGRAFYAASVVIDVCRQFGDLPADLHEKHKYARWRFVEISKAMKEGRTPAPPPDLGSESLFDLPSTGADGADAAGGDLAGAGAGAGGGGGGGGGGGAGELTSRLISPSSALTGGLGPPPPMPPPPHQPFPPDACGYGGYGGGGSAVPPGCFGAGMSPYAPLPPPHLPPPQLQPHARAAYAPPPPAHGQHASPAPFYAPSAQPIAPPPAPAAAAAVGPDAMFAAQRHAKFAVSALQFADVPTAVQNLHLALAALGVSPR